MVPVLRFARDRRGYESTYLVEPGRRGAQEPACLLYWFRSPPHVKIGRAAFDEEAIRLLEQQHPELEFDWERILIAKPPAAPETREPREQRPRPERRGGREPRRDDSRAAGGPTERRPRIDVHLPPPPKPEEVTRAPVPEPERVPTIQPELQVPVFASPPLEPAPVRRFVRVFDRASEPPTELPAEHHASDLSACERLLGPEQLTILRARYAEILARIAARGGDPARLEALREQAERVNPDAWVTDAEVSLGLAGVDIVLADLHQKVGRRRRRRRRGGKGRHVGSGVPLPQAGDADLPESGDANAEDDGPDDEPAGDE